MADLHSTEPFPVIAPTCRWCHLAEGVLDGQRLTFDKGLAMFVP